MLDTHAVARSLTKADFTPAQADAITSAILQAREKGDHVTADQFRAASPSSGPRSPRSEPKLRARFRRLRGR